jgi:phosphohistidine phosphatase
MKTLLILRHAKSSWNHPGIDDHDRPLNARGKRDAPRMGQLLQAEGLTPDLLLTSTAKRAHLTALHVAEASGYAGDVVLTADLYHAFPDDCLTVLSQWGDPHKKVLIVAHNPGLEALVKQLTGQSVRLPTATLVQITLPLETWQNLQASTPGELINLWRPKEL